MNWYVKVLKQYADFKGRARRKEYWMFVLINAIISIIMMVLDNLLGTTYGPLNEDGYFETIYSIATLVPSLAVSARRMHDVGKSGWYMLIPIYNLILFCTDGDEEPNKWGENPKHDSHELMINQIGKE
ncbi:DUF805 domain-containing protein [Polaribacter reichenbachii]|uniref:Uncharacterized protein n=1 Tax=Polaribacter reichenbachii TaxID=996801 RepID=A0A1B8U1H8_9FLAO|nr:DUF805 domain-containing protein [Polaribacter reichenbachii]APZ47311.1 DUF805 domain-containing protein [Polaribacter reichenbachii]AUC17952.1 DUF805 domain-containing protein [Polaribacter reichenbachii]OBY65723.1 hypothetical protein LPB301_07875 [Polaribacter reichenbachii]